MLLELSTLPLAFQQQITAVTHGEVIDLAKDGKVFATIIPKQIHSNTTTVYDLLMAGDYPDEVADIELEEMPRQPPNLNRFMAID